MCILSILIKNTRTCELIDQSVNCMKFFMKMMKDKRNPAFIQRNKKDQGEMLLLKSQFSESKSETLSGKGEGDFMNFLQNISKVDIYFYSIFFYTFIIMYCNFIVYSILLDIIIS